MIFVEYRKRLNGTSEYWTTKSVFELILQRQRKRKKQINNWFKSKYQNDPFFRKKYNEKKNKARRFRYKTDKSFKQKLNDANIEYAKKKRNNDNIFKLIGNIRALIRHSFKNNGFDKSNKTTQILGCTIPDFKTHIESQFLPGMTWENRSQWHIDHIMPVSMAKTYDEVVRLNHYKNLRPLWAHDNLRKSDKIGDTLVLF